MTDNERKDIIKKCCDIWNKLKEKSDIVEVLIQEKFNNFALEQENKQLKEKIEELENRLEHYSNDKWYIDLNRLNIPNEVTNRVIKQVCDEIREKLQPKAILLDDDYLQEVVYWEDICSALDKMEVKE